MQKLFENWRKYRKDILTEKKLVYSTDPRAGFKAARGLDREKWPSKLGDIDEIDPQADQARAMKEAMAVIEANRPKHPILSEVVEELIQKIIVTTAGMAAGTKLPYVLSQIISGSDTLRGGRLGGRRKIRQFLQKLLTRWVPVLGWAMLAKDIYDYFLSIEAGENREEIIQDFKTIVQLIKVPTRSTS